MRLDKNLKFVILHSELFKKIKILLDKHFILSRMVSVGSSAKSGFITKFFIRGKNYEQTC